MVFDPKAAMKNAGGGGKRDEDTRPVPAGTYLLAMRWYKRRTSNAGKPGIRGKFEVIYGPAKGRILWCGMSLNEASGGAMVRLAAYCQCVGDDSPFDLMDDTEFRRRFKHQPFKARISCKTERGSDGKQYTNNDIERFEPELTEEELAFIDTWLEEDRAERDAAAAQAAATGEDPGGDDAPPPTDSDIPF